MDFFSKLGDTITSVGRDVTQKAKDVSGIAKLKLDIKSKEDYIKEQYIALGKAYYEKNKDKDVPEKAQFDRIEEAMADIDKMELLILELKKARKCPGCGAEAAETAEYCSVCGMKLSVCEGTPQEDSPEVSVEVVEDAPYKEAGIAED